MRVMNINLDGHNNQLEQFKVDKEVGLGTDYIGVKSPSCVLTSYVEETFPLEINK